MINSEREREARQGPRCAPLAPVIPPLLSHPGALSRPRTQTRPCMKRSVHSACIPPGSDTVASGIHPHPGSSHSSLFRNFLNKVRCGPTTTYSMSTARVTVHQGKESGGPPVQQSPHGVTPACCVSSAIGGLNLNRKNSWETQPFLSLGPWVVCFEAVLA